MLKQTEWLKSSAMEEQAERELRQTLARVPSIRAAQTLGATHAGDFDADFSFPVVAYHGERLLLCEVKREAQPRQARSVAYHLQRQVAAVEASGKCAYGILISDWLSPQTRELLREEGIGYLDLAGNCLVAFDGVYIEREGFANPSRRRRGAVSVFARKSARVLRVLLAEPRRPWKVTELSERAGVSLGLVSNVRRALCDQEWAVADGAGLVVTQPGHLLTAWRGVYRAPGGDRLRFHTLLHGKALEEALRDAFAEVGRDGRLLLASFSAASWLAPYARVGGTFLYADATPLALMQQRLGLETVAQGDNVQILQPTDSDVFMEPLEPVPPVRCTSAVQTYLDLSVAGERGAEAAEHLRHEVIEPAWGTAR